LSKDMVDEDDSQPSTQREGENPFKFVIPQKFLDFYHNIERWITKKNAQHRFISELLREDPD